MKDKKREESAKTGPGSSKNRGLDRMLEGGDEEAFTPAYLEIQKHPPAPLARTMAYTLMGVVAAAFLWAFLSEFDIVVTAPGKVVPSDRIKLVQPFETGIVKAIHVRDGQAIKAGQILIELDPTSSQADRNRLSRDVLETGMEVRRLNAQAAGKPRIEDVTPTDDLSLIRTQNLLLKNRLAEHGQKMAALNQEIARKRAERAGVEASIRKLQATMPLLEKRLNMKEELVKDAYVSEMAVIDSRLEVANQKNDLVVLKAKRSETIAAENAAAKSRTQADAEFRYRTLTELAEAKKRYETAAQELVKAEQRKQQQLLTAPCDGIVQQLAVHTVGGVVTAAQPLLTVVPEGTNFEIEAQVLNKDIGFVHPGQDVVVKLDAFEYTKYGYLNGRLQWVGTDAIQDQKLGLIYPVRILVSSNQLPGRVAGRNPSIGAGMSVTADITVQKRGAYEYFLGPLLRYKNEAMRER
ncbi:MAG TPA: HlyD family type I secretion periplasmic adaptor subunit [Syntrophales bacterium]|nr:HlyD family type I secretion periplasmic adaptor subunit [Syntrophales bacterium]